MFYGNGISDLYDEMQTSAAAYSSSSGSSRANSQIVELTSEVERLAMLNEALWRLIRDRLEISEEDLIRTVTDVDLEDGALDGKRRRQPKASNCPRCRRKTSDRRPVCMYCGEPIIQNPFD